MTSEPLDLIGQTNDSHAPTGAGLAAPFLDSLHAHGRLRVWSIVITIFGDMVQPRSTAEAPARLALSDLARLTEGLGITAGALRTAVSRLTKEGWLERHKEGRSAWYQLSASGAANVQAASQRIYAPATAPAVRAWRLELAKAGAAAAEPPSAPKREDDTRLRYTLSDSLSLIALQSGHQPPAARDALVLEGQVVSLPDWLFDNLIPPAVTQDYAELANLLQPLTDRCAQLAALPPHQAIVLRCLLLHFWRRLVLKHRPLPINLLPQDWPGQTCSQVLPTLYAALWSASEAWLEAAGLPPRQEPELAWTASV